MSLMRYAQTAMAEDAIIVHFLNLKNYEEVFKMQKGKAKV
jgi:hypothetical protein